jgi:hypothetical protein
LYRGTTSVDTLSVFALYQGTTSVDTRSVLALYQGTTSVVPQRPKNVGL